METKSTLKLDKPVIETTKQDAEKNNRSLSRLVKSLTGIVSEEEAEKWAKEDPRIRYILTKVL
jgi:hypothetical protein